MLRTFNLNNNRFKITITLSLFGIIYASISLVNHYFFRTSALDLGLYTNALYDYSHLQWNDSTTFKKVSENLLADHFDLYLIIFSPLSYLFGSYTLLIVQISAILLGGLGVNKYFKSISPGYALNATIYFLSFFAIYSALAFDYHSNVIAAMVVPWFLLYFKKGKYLVSFLLLFFILIAKENMSLWMVFICLGLTFDYLKYKKQLFVLSSFILFSASYYFVVVHWIMPGISNSGSYPHFHYSAIGNNSFDAVIHILLHPIDSAKMMFINHTGDPAGDYVKLEFHLLALLSGGFLLFFKPNYLIMLIPVYFQKLFHDYVTMWSVADHYSIELTPILAIGGFIVISRVKSKKWKNYLSYILIFLAVAVTIRVMDSTTVYTNKSSVRFYNVDHYHKDYNVKLVHNKLKEIPGNVAISVQTNFLPHLALRNKAYQFPIIKDAEYVILAPCERPYPINQEDYDKLVEEIDRSSMWNLYYSSSSILIYKKQIENSKIGE